MPIEEVRGLIGFFGLLTQAGGAVLLVTLFGLLRRHARRRPYFLAWSDAWLALALALVALVVRYNLLPSYSAESDELRLEVRLLYIGYQAGKFMHFALLVFGVVRYARGTGRSSLPPLVWSLAWGLALVSVAASPDLDALLIWQAPVALTTLGYCGFALLSLPRRRRSLGTRATGVVFAVMAVLWVGYFFAFLSAPPPGSGSGTLEDGPLQMLASYNSFVDLLLQILLGFGMVLIVMEDSRREIEDAHAELAVAHDQLRRLALYDPLTGCLNRRAFSDRVGLERIMATYGTVLVMDLDDLKEVNDTYGHAAGDELLRYLAEVLRGNLRASDKLYRWGGDEFVLLAPMGRASQVQPRIEAILRAAPPLRLISADAEVPLRVSVGAADYLSGEELGAAIAAADGAMYRQKVRAKRSTEPGGVPAE